MSLIKTPIQTNNVELAQGVSDKYWKLILPFKEINYKGRTIKFDESYMNEAIRAFRDKVTGDQTAFQLANDDNEHYSDEDKRTGRYYDPARFHGEFDDMEIRKNRSDSSENGLWARLAPTEAGDKLINNNKKLGVSASIEENVDYEGKSYPVVVRHVLGTLDPKVRGTGLWEKAELSLSNESDKNKEVIDLTSTETPPDEKSKEGQDVKVTKEWYDNVNKFIERKMQEEKDAEEFVDSLVKEEATEPENTSTSTTDLSNAIENHPKFIELSNSNANNLFEKKADEWRRAGVPNVVIEKAKGVLSDGKDSTINLSNGTEIDNKEFIYSLIDEFKGTIDFSNPKTHQQPKEADEDEIEEKAKEAFVDFFKNMKD